MYITHSYRAEHIDGLDGHYVCNILCFCEQTKSRLLNQSCATPFPTYPYLLWLNITSPTVGAIKSVTTLPVFSYFPSSYTLGNYSVRIFRACSIKF